MRGFLTVLLCIVGLGGLIFAALFIPFIFQNPGDSQILLPALTFIAVVWVGSIMFFGLAALLCRQPEI
jgi:quinol-cytochrome oxidoreductase complex cytochrome b subunit